MYIKLRTYCSWEENLLACSLKISLYNVSTGHSLSQASLIDNFFLRRYSPTRAKADSFFKFLDHPTKRYITVCRTPLDE